MQARKQKQLETATATVGLGIFTKKNLKRFTRKKNDENWSGAAVSQILVSYIFVE